MRPENSAWHRFGSTYTDSDGWRRETVVDKQGHDVFITTDEGWEYEEIKDRERLTKDMQPYKEPEKSVFWNKYFGNAYFIMG
jgi:hypothetical protein